MTGFHELYHRYARDVYRFAQRRRTRIEALPETVLAGGPGIARHTELKEELSRVLLPGGIGWMKVTRDVIQDLLPASLAGEASTDTSVLVEDFLKTDPELARAVEGMRANPIPELPPAFKPTKEKEALEMIRSLLRWRGNLLGFATFLTLLPLSFGVRNGRLSWLWYRDAPPALTVAIVAAALGAWVAFFLVRRRLLATGL